MKRKISRGRGFTLMEVMVALAIMAIVAVLASQAFNTASTGAAATREAMERLASIDQTLVYIENDIRNAMPKTIMSIDNDPLPAFRLKGSDDYWLMVLRGGVSNDLYQLRSEMVRVAYRWEDETIWRDTWFNPADTDQDLSRKRKLVTGVEDLIVKVLPRNAASVVSGPWLDTWPPNAGVVELPMALEVTLVLKDMGEIKRMFMILPGLPPGTMVPGANNGQQGGQNQNGQQQNDPGTTNETGQPNEGEVNQ
jgi:general secretion pathway protein J